MQATEHHYCFDATNVASTYGRLHIPLARQCTMNCSYCSYKTNKNISETQKSPGSSNCVLCSYDEIDSYISQKLKQFSNVKIIGLSGPGDPLENMLQIDYLTNIMSKKYPDLILCVCSNGRLYNDRVKSLLQFNQLKYFTLTVNTLHAEKYNSIYCQNNREFSGSALIDNQLKIIDLCVSNGVKVKVNTVLLNGINDDEVESMYKFLYSLGVSCFNLIPKLDCHGQPDSNTLKRYNAIIESLEHNNIPIIKRCLHCRSDYCSSGTYGDDLL